MRNSSHPILHLAHPRPIPWNAVISAVSNALELPLVPYAEWVQSLQKSGEGLDAKQEATALRTNPALRLLDFFTDVDAELHGEALGVPIMDLTKAVEVAPALNADNLPQLSEADVSKWVAYVVNSDGDAEDSAS